MSYQRGGGIIATDVWECSCGAGHLSKRLEELGHNVLSTDLINRGYGIGGVDFLLCDKAWGGDILTNPPYKYATEFTLHALDLIHPGSKVFMFLKLTFLESSKRRRLFDTKQLTTVYVFSKRILCAKNGNFQQMIADGGSAVAYAWFEFEKGYCGDPIIKWVN